MSVWFKENTHKYTNGEDEYLSVTTFIKRFYEEFDSDYWLDYKTCEAFYVGLKKHDGKYIKGDGFYKEVKSKGLENIMESYICNSRYQIIREEISKAWREKNTKATTKGTAYHKQQEQNLYDKKNILHQEIMLPVVKREVQKGDNQFSEIKENGCYPEYLVFNNDVMLAGQMDVLYAVDGNVWIEDYKTNEKLVFEAYNKKTMKYPFECIQDCSFGHYTLQLSIYGWMMEQMGMSVKELTIIHDNKRIPVQYIKKEIDEAMKIRRGELSPL